MSIFTCVNNVNLYCHRYRCCYDTSAHAVVMLLISYRRICCDATHVAMLLYYRRCRCRITAASVAANTAAAALSTPPLLPLLLL